MSDEIAVADTTPEEAGPIKPFADRRVFQHAGLGLHLEMHKCANDLVQRDMDKFMKRFAEQPQGTSVAEDNGKTVRAALRAEWIDLLSTPAGAILSGNDVDNMKPSHVRWVAGIIDQIYNTAREVPNA